MSWSHAVFRRRIIKFSLLLNFKLIWMCMYCTRYLIWKEHTLFLQLLIRCKHSQCPQIILRPARILGPAKAQHLLNLVPSCWTASFLRLPGAVAVPSEKLLSLLWVKLSSLLLHFGRVDFAEVFHCSLPLPSDWNSETQLHVMWTFSFVVSAHALEFAVCATVW